MARRALLVGINNYRGNGDLLGCVNDVENMRSVLKNYLGFTNNDIRVALDERATKEGILYRLEYMIKLAKPGDFMVFHFSGHGSQIRDRDGDERLEDGLDELLCPHDLDWNGNFILDDDLDDLFQRIPDGAFMEVFLDCCHSGTGTRDFGPPPSMRSGCNNDFTPPEEYKKSRFMQPPRDIELRAEGEEDDLKRWGFMAGNRSGRRSMGNHVLWSGCRSDQTSADAYIGGRYNGAFSYFFCKHMRETGGNISRRSLLEQIRSSLRYGGYTQVPQLMCMDQNVYEHNPLQMPAPDEARRSLYLTTPYIRGYDVKRLQEGLRKSGYGISADGVYGPHTREIVLQFQRDNDLMVDGIAGSRVFDLLES